MHYFAVFALVLVAALILVLAINRPQNVVINTAVPVDFPADGFSHDLFEDLLSRYVDSNGKVGYDRWHDSPEAVTELDSYLAAVVRFSPDATPQRFEDRNAELAYWMYAYNAYVIKSVLDYIRSIAPASLAKELARASDYQLIYRDYDWSINVAGRDQSD